MKKSSKECGQIMLANKDGGLAAADAASGQVLWQKQAAGESNNRRTACVGTYMLAQQQGSKTVDIYELDTGKQTASFAVDSDSLSMVGTDGSVVLVALMPGGPALFAAYDLNTGKQLWTSPRGESGRYLLSNLDGIVQVDGRLAGGGLYYATSTQSGSLTRLGQKP